MTKMMFYFSSSFSTNKTEIVGKNRRKFQKIVFWSFLFFCFLPEDRQDSEKGNGVTQIYC